MTVKCPACGSTANVTVGDKTYCTNCGGVVAADSAPTVAAAAVLPVATARTAPAPSRRLMDIAAPAQVTQVPIVTPTISHIENPTSSGETLYPSQLMPTSRLTADRLMTAAAVPKSELVSRFVPKLSSDNEAVPMSVVSAGVVPTGSLVMPDPMPVVEPVPVPTQHTIDHTVEQTKSIPVAESMPAAIQNQPANPVLGVIAPVTDLTSSQSTPAAVTLAPQTLPPNGPVFSDIRPQVATVVPAPPPPSDPILPENAVTNHQSLQQLIADTKPTLSKDTVSRIAMGDNAPTPAPRPMAVAVTAFAVVIMGGYIWLQNYPRMALHAAAAKAGFVASLPEYVPSSYSLSGGINSQPGVVSYSYASAGGTPFTVTQRSTTWDSIALLDNYVITKSNDYSSVPGEGLTVYLYNNNQAAWVNHGVWYTIEGATHLSRDQILKIAYSL